MRVLLLLILCFVFTEVTAQELRFTILHTNDEHSTLLPSPMADYHPEITGKAKGGFARLATKVREIRAESALRSEPVLMFSGGDIFGGSPFAWLILDGYAAELSLMQHIGYDAIVVGNHEFDYGPEVFARYAKAAGYPDANAHTTLLSSNIEIPSGHILNEVDIQAYRLIDLDHGLRIGVFGLLGKDAVSVAPYAEPVTFAEQHETAAKMVKKLKNFGADVIIAVTHSGIPEDRALARAVPEIDLIVGGHDHQEIPEPILEGRTVILQSGYYLRNLGRARFAYDAETKRIHPINEADEPYLIPLDASVAEDPETAVMIAEYEIKLNQLVARLTSGQISDVRESVAKSEYNLTRSPAFSETQVGNFATDAMRLITERITGERVHFAFQGNGVLRADITPGVADFSRFQLPFLDFATIAGLGTGPDYMPGYPIVSVYLTGKEIYRVLEISALLSQFLGNTYFLQVSGLRYTYEPRNTILFRVPFLGIPVPTYRSVKEVVLYDGEGFQLGDEFSVLQKDDHLYHVVSDYYVASFMPMIGNLLPNLQIVLKDKYGNPLSSIDEAVVHQNGEELKVWQTLVTYAMELAAKDPNGFLPDYYIHTGDRIIEKRGFPLVVLPAFFLLILIFVVYLVIKRFRA